MSEAHPDRGETRPAVRTTHRLYIGGAFRRSDSGRVIDVRGPDGGYLASAALASGKDAREAVTAARAAFPAWSGAAASQRGQLLYRVAELLEEHRDRFAADVLRATSGSADPAGANPAVATAEANLAGANPAGAEAAAAEVDAAVDRWVWYAGWADKLGQVRGSANPVAGPFVSYSVPEPAGVVAVLAPRDSALLGLVSVVAPAIVSGNTAVIVASERYPLPAIALAEVLAGARLGAGVVNVLTGEVAEIAPWLAAHQDVNAIDLAGAPGALADDLAVAAAGTLKRVVRLPDADWSAEPGLERMFAAMETKTVWHPVGA
jgi:acyl-CoA reductase-like NAD-dependent aldehyde dehydrogenase